MAGGTRLSKAMHARLRTRPTHTRFHRLLYMATPPYDMAACKQFKLHDVRETRLPAKFARAAVKGSRRAASEVGQHATWPALSPPVFHLPIADQPAPPHLHAEPHRPPDSLTDRACAAQPRAPAANRRS